MRYIFITLLFLVFSTHVQAEWNWVSWEKHTRINGQQEEVLTDWKAVALFADKVGCEDHVEAILHLLSERFSQRKDGSEVLFQIITEGEDLGKLTGVLSKKGDQSSLIESRCLQQKTVNIMENHFTGNNYRRLSHIEKQRYVSGIIHGTLTAPIFGAPKENMEWIEKCITNMTGEQSVAILEKYMADNPERWNSSMNLIFLSTMHGVCRPQKKQK